MTLLTHDELVEYSRGIKNAKKIHEIINVLEKYKGKTILNLEGSEVEINKQIELIKKLARGDKDVDLTMIVEGTLLENVIKAIKTEQKDAKEKKPNEGAAAGAPSSSDAKKASGGPAERSAGAPLTTTETNSLLDSIGKAKMRQEAAAEEEKKAQFEKKRSEGASAFAVKHNEQLKTINQLDPKKASFDQFHIIPTKGETTVLHVINIGLEKTQGEELIKLLQSHHFKDIPFSEPDYIFFKDNNKLLIGEKVLDALSNKDSPLYENFARILKLPSPTQKPKTTTPPTNENLDLVKKIIDTLSPGATTLINGKDLEASTNQQLLGKTHSYTDKLLKIELNKLPSNLKDNLLKMLEYTEKPPKPNIVLTPDKIQELITKQEFKHLIQQAETLKEAKASGGKQKAPVPSEDILIASSPVFTSAQPLHREHAKAKDPVVSDPNVSIAQIKKHFSDPENCNKLGVKHPTVDTADGGLTLHMANPANNVNIKPSPQGGVTYSADEPITDDKIKQNCDIALAMAKPGTEFNLKNTDPKIAAKVHDYLKIKIDAMEEAKRPKIVGYESAPAKREPLRSAKH